MYANVCSVVASLELFLRMVIEKITINVLYHNFGIFLGSIF